VLEKVKGYDTFFHFYGAEDVDLCQRIENTGCTITIREELFFIIIGISFTIHTMMKK
jgi:predicted glycosyltransferase involved in capsule biosynthesis